MKILVTLFALASIPLSGLPGATPPAADLSPPITGFMTAERLKAYCDDSAEPDEQPTCLGYMAGVVDQLLLADALGTRRRLCVPQPYTLGELRTAFLDEMQQPHEQDTAASLVLDIAVLKAFSCQRFVERR